MISVIHEWGSGGRWFKSSRPDHGSFEKTALLLNQGEAVFFCNGPTRFCDGPVSFRIKVTRHSPLHDGEMTEEQI
jgi:hypothetical protein